ncbi:MAG: type II secretion system protein N [Candidatus Chromulinivorax sp.]|nr:type II secretion system protein N [Candidatus Chromulinivorax sp.]
MKQSVWILNSSLLVLFFISQLLLFMIQRAIPRRVPISPDKVVEVKEQQAAPVDIVKIYEQDLFGTYEAPVTPVASLIEDIVAPIPSPPKIIIPEVPVEKAPTFFAPLDVVLKGVIFVKDDAASCIAIVQLKKTKEEKNYQVGDLIEDAQILKILSNRIIIIRSNGQQETLYLREEDAISDFNTDAKFTPKSIIEDASDNKYTINIDEFTKRVHNLGDFISLLDLSTVYKRGKSFGCRIGRIEKDSLGSMLGFMMDDIIVKVDDFYVDDLSNRIQLYDHIIQKHVGDVIEVVINRGQDTLVFMYGLVDNLSKTIVFTPQQTHQHLIEELAKHEHLSQSMATDQSVSVQSISQEQSREMMLDAPRNEDVIDTMTFNFEESLPQNIITQQKLVTPSNKAISAQVQDNQAAIQSSGSRLSDRHYKKLEEEYKKFAPTIPNMKSQDKKSMMKRSRGVISQAIQQ